MAVDAYVSMAVSQLHSAVSALHDEIRRTQLGAYDHEQHIKLELSHDQYDRTNTKAQAEALGMEGDDSGKQQAQSRLKQIDVNIQQKQQAINSQSQGAADVVARKTELLGRLQSIVSQLEPLVARSRE